MTGPSPTEVEPRPRRPGRWVLGIVVGVIVLAAPLAYLALDGDSPAEEARVVETPQALTDVRAALGRSADAGSYEMDTESTTTSASPCGPVGTAPSGSTPGSTPTCRVFTQRFSSHTVVNFEPYAMVSVSDTPFGEVTLHVDASRVWQLGGATVGYGPGMPGVAIPDYARQVLGTLGPGPGALAMISIASRGGHLNLEEQAVASAEPAGTGTVRGVAVTYYDVTIDVTKLADTPGLSPEQRSTIDAALPILEDSGYRGTTERIGIDEAGFVREVVATTTMDDGSTMTRHSFLYGFGCAPRVTMPGEPPAPEAPTGPCLPDTTTTTSAPVTTTTSTPAATTAPTTTTSSTAAPPPTAPPTSPSTTGATTPATTTAASGG